MNPIFIKSLIGVGVAGASVAGGYGIYSVASKASAKIIAQALEEDSTVVILSVEEDADKGKWETKVNELKSDSSAVGLIGFVESQESSEDAKKKANIATLKEICKKLFNLDFSDTSKLEAAKKWCTNPKEPSS